MLVKVQDGVPIWVEKGARDGQNLGISLQIESKRSGKVVVIVGFKGLLIAAHLQESADDAEAFGYLSEIISLLLGTVGLLGEVVDHALAV